MVRWLCGADRRLWRLLQAQSTAATTAAATTAAATTAAATTAAATTTAAALAVITVLGV